MTKNIFSLLMLAAVLVWTGCQSDEDLSPIATFDKSGKGAYPRLLAVSGGEFDLQDFSIPIDYTVEFVTLDQGANVETYEVLIAFVDNNDFNGDMSVDATSYRTFSQADFSDNENGFRQVSVSLSATEMADALGINSDDFEPGDFFEMTGRITLADGSTFTSSNTTPTIRTGGAFAGYFSARYTLTCPVPNDRFVGDYQMSYVEPPAGAYGPAFGENPPEVTLSLVEGSSTKRQFEALYLPDLDLGQPASELEFDLVCDETIFSSGQSGGVGCGGTITLGPGEENASFDFNDDSEIIINISEFENDGGCGVPATPLVIKLTKL